MHLSVWLFPSDISHSIPFVCLFTKVIRSQYKSSFSFKTELTQDDALGFSLDGTVPDEIDLMRKVQDFVIRNPHTSNPTFPYNPCDYGMELCSIKQGDMHMQSPRVHMYADVFI